MFWVGRCLFKACTDRPQLQTDSWRRRDSNLQSPARGAAVLSTVPLCGQATLLSRGEQPSAAGGEMTPAGLEPAIPGSAGRCLIHWATGPSASWASFQIQKRSKAKAKSKYLASSFGTLMPRGDDCFAMRTPKGAQGNMRHVSLLQVGGNKQWQRQCLPIH